MPEKLWFFVCLTVVGVFSAKIPKEYKLQKCGIKTPNFEECFRAAIEDAIPKLKDGAPSLGLPPLDPLEIVELAIDPGREGPVSLKLKFKNFKIYGIATPGNILLTGLKVDKKTNSFHINTTNLHISMKGRYESKGRLLAIPIDGEGPFNIELGDVRVKVMMQLKEKERKGVKYWDLVKMDYNVISVGSSKMKMENIIKGNKDLDESLNASLNENSEELGKQMYPAFGKALNLYFMALSQRFFNKVPASELFDGSPFA